MFRRMTPAECGNLLQIHVDYHLDSSRPSVALNQSQGQEI
jgi:hypothetical protein